MRKILSLLALLTVLSGTASAQTTIAYWNFNALVPNWGSPISASTGTGTLTHDFVPNPSTFAGSAVNVEGADLAGAAFCPLVSASPDNNGKSLTLAIPTTGFNALTFSYVTRFSSATGFTTQTIDYSTDGGMNFTTTGLSGNVITGLSTTFELKTVSFSGITAAENNANFRVRITVSGGSASGSNNRFDNVKLTGTVVSSAPANPSAFSVAANGTTSQVVTWTAGGGTGSLLVRSAAGGSLSGSPTDGTPHAVNDALLGGTVVYRGTGTSFRASGLTASSAYTYRVYAFDASNVYSTGTVATSQTTAASNVEAVDAAFTGLLTFDNGVAVNFLTGAGANATITSVRNAGSPGTNGLPIAGVTTSAGTRTINVVSTDRWWTISASSALSGNYQIGFDIAGLTSAPNPNALALLKRANAGAPWTAISTTTNTVPPAIGGLSSGFSDFAIGSDGADNPLPVTLSSFTGTVSGETVQLNWRTASETNNKGFEIFRDGVQIGGENGQGTTTNATDYSYSDRTVDVGKTYTYRLRSVDFSGLTHDYTTVSVEVKAGVPAQAAEYKLYQNYPNPFNPTTNFSFDLKEAGNVKLEIFNVLGEKVATLVDGFRAAGAQPLATWNASGVSSGVYFYRLSTASFTQTRKLTLTK